MRNAEFVIFLNALFWRMITEYSYYYSYMPKQDYNKTNTVTSWLLRAEISFVTSMANQNNLFIQTILIISRIVTLNKLKGF